MARTAFLNDTFTEASNTTLTSHTPETGGAWALQSGFATAMTVVGADDRGIVRLWDADNGQLRQSWEP